MVAVFMTSVWVALLKRCEEIGKIADFGDMKDDCRKDRKECLILVLISELTSRKVRWEASYIAYEKAY